MIFSVQNSNLMYSVEFSPDLVQIQVRETVSGVFLARMDIPIQVWHMVEVMRRDFNEHQESSHFVKKKVKHFSHLANKSETLFASCQKH